MFFLQYGGVAYVVIAGTGMTFLAYVLCNIAVLRGRLRGWPRKAGTFSLGRKELLLNVLAVVWGVAMVANLYWHRPQTNPKADETSGALNFGSASSIRSRCRARRRGVTRRFRAAERAFPRPARPGREARDAARAGSPRP